MQDLFQLNFISYFAACKFALPHLRKVGGNIINMSSLTGVFGQSAAPTYTATKGAITSFSKGLASDNTDRGSVRTLHVLESADGVPVHFLRLLFYPAHIHALSPSSSPPPLPPSLPPSLSLSLCVLRALSPCTVPCNFRPYR